MRHIPFVGQIEVGSHGNAYSPCGKSQAGLAADEESDGTGGDGQEEQRAETVGAHHALTECGDCRGIGRICQRIGV